MLGMARNEIIWNRWLTIPHYHISPHILIVEHVPSQFRLIWILISTGTRTGGSIISVVSPGLPVICTYVHKQMYIDIWHSHMFWAYWMFKLLTCINVDHRHHKSQSLCEWPRHLWDPCCPRRGIRSPGVGFNSLGGAELGWERCSDVMFLKGMTYDYLWL